MSAQTDAFVTQAIRSLLRQPPRGASLVLVGPALVYGEDDALMFMVIRGVPGGDHRQIGIGLGRLVPDPMDDPLARMFDTVMHVRRAGETTLREGRSRREAFIAGLRRGKADIEVHESDEDLVAAYVREFPGERSRKTLAAFAEERAAAGAASGHG